MEGTVIGCDRVLMPDIRCMLPSVPVALIAGTWVAFNVGIGVAAERPWLSLSIGAAVAVAVGRAVSRSLITRSERARRRLGYIGATIVGVGVGGVLALVALGTGLCGTWGEQCSPEELAAIDRLAKMALAAPFLVVGSYAVVDLTTLHARRR